MMEIIQLTYPTNYKRTQLEPTSLAVGFFDGVHLGHQQVIQTAIEQANKKGLAKAVMTFEPHPLEVLKDEPLHNHLLTSLEEKQSIIRQMGVDYLFVVTFDRSLSKLSPQEFVDLFFIDLNVQHVTAGFDYSFGHKGTGKIKDMDYYAKGRLDYSVVDKVSVDGEKVSSTSIRQFLHEGDQEQANQLLGRPFSLTGEVVRGFQRGREIGYPTANLAVDDSHVIPKVGIYAVTAHISGQTYKGMASIGYNPTFENEHTKPSIEVHVFDLNENLYGKTIQVDFLAYLRDEVAYQGVDQLIEQLKLDEVDAKKVLDKLN